MSLGQCFAAIDGWKRVNVPDDGKPEPPTDDELEEMLANSRI